MLSIIKQVDEYVSLLVLSIGLITVSLPNLYKVFVVERKKRKIELFLKNNRLVNVTRIENTKTNFRTYMEKHRDVCVGGNEEHRLQNLLIHQHWVLPREDNSQGLPLLKEVKVHFVEQPDSIKIPKFRFFPDKRSTYTDNLIQYKYSAESNNKALFNGPLYCVSDVYLNEQGLNLNVYRADYYGFMNTCKALEIESIYKRKGKYRKNTHLFDLNNRYCGIGINCLTILQQVEDNGKLGNYFLIHQRSQEVAESPGLIHAVPAGSHQPTLKLDGLGLRYDCLLFDQDLSNTVYREYCEELLDVEGMDELGSIEFMKQNEHYLSLVENSQIYFLGVGLEPLNTKFEVLSVMVQDIKGKKSLKEFQEHFEKLKHFEGSIKIKPFTKGMIEQYISERNITPSFREMMLQAYQHFDELNRVK